MFKKERPVLCLLRVTSPPPLELSHNEEPDLAVQQVLGNADFHQGLGPYTHQDGAQCTEHHFQEWHWEGQDTPQYVVKGPKLVSRQGASLRV